jgi:hypothetical protein
MKSRGCIENNNYYTRTEAKISAIQKSFEIRENQLKEVK